MTDPIEAACRAVCAASRPTADPDKLSPSPRSWREMRPVWQSYEHLARAALEAAERAAWVEAPHAPAEWEGTVVLCAHPDERPVELRLLPHGYSRDPRHCGGIRVRKLPVPPNVGEKPAWTEMEKATP